MKAIDAKEVIVNSFEVERASANRADVLYLELVIPEPDSKKSRLNIWLVICEIMGWLGTNSNTDICPMFDRC